MRPYLAIIKDSFKAAFASRVLYVLLLLITLVLLALAPLHVQVHLDSQVRLDDVAGSYSRLLGQFGKRSKPGAERVWGLLPDEIRSELESQYANRFSDDKLSPKEKTEFQKRLVLALNEIVKRSDFYRESDWPENIPGLEVNDLIAAGPTSLETKRQQRLNRLLLGQALRSLGAGPPSQMSFHYGPWEMFMGKMELNRAQLKSSLFSFLPGVFDALFTIGLLIALLVTANIIPETFDPGSLNLLLSKPISRVGLYLTKFVGGCSLVALCATYLFSGVWLWMGLAMGIWSQAFVWSIPVYILVFAIYYSVSAFIGLKYRSSILAIVVTALFWGFCFVIGFSHSLLGTRVDNGGMAGLCRVGETVAAVQGTGDAMGWSNEEGVWNTTRVVELQQAEEMAVGMAIWTSKLMPEAMRLPPVQDSETGRVFMGAYNVMKPLSVNKQYLVTGQIEKNELEFVNVGAFPAGTVAMFATPDGLLLATNSGKLLLVDPQKIPQQASGAIKWASGSKVLTPQSSLAMSPHGVDFNQSNGELAVVQSLPGKHEVHLFKPNSEGVFQRDRVIEFDLGTTAKITCHVAYQGQHLVVVAGNGTVLLFDAPSGELLEMFGTHLAAGESGAGQGGGVVGQEIPVDRFVIQRVQGAKNGERFGLLCRDQTLWVLDSLGKTLKQAAVPGQGTISAFALEDAHLLVADRGDRVRDYDWGDAGAVELEREYAPSHWTTRLHYLLVKPLYTLCPKPGEFRHLVTELSYSTSSDEELKATDFTLDLLPKDPYAALWSSSLFMLFMLLLACTYFHFKDF